VRCWGSSFGGWDKCGDSTLVKMSVSGRGMGVVGTMPSRAMVVRVTDHLGE
jgi:hypothetical protein